MFDVARVRGLYTSLGEGWIYLNAAERAQIPERVASGVSTSFRTAPLLLPPEPGRKHSAHGLMGSQQSVSARRAVADLFSVAPEQVIVGASLPVLYRALMAAGERLFRGAPVVSTAPFAGVETTLATYDLATGELPAWQFSRLVTGATRLVAVPAVHPLVGTVAPLAQISDRVHAASRAWVLADVSALAPYRPVDIDDLGIDVAAVDLAALGGPDVAALVVRDVAMLNRLGVVDPGPVSAGLLGGVAPLVDHYSLLDDQVRGSRSGRIRDVMMGVDSYLSGLLRYLTMNLQGLPAVHVVGITGEAAGYGLTAVDRVPRLTVLVRNTPTQILYQRLVENGIVVQVTPRDDLLEQMGVFEQDGALTIGLAPFNTVADVDELTRVLASFY
ncbi:MAG: aminotransferase class V-fold PLP-dependent enzyme [Corynebacterium sp.]|nr:aminotransferase class V-fold PLP-dependent enzyme [Corynebacterium sp.]